MKKDIDIPMNIIGIIPRRWKRIPKIPQDFGISDEDLGHVGSGILWPPRQVWTAGVQFTPHITQVGHALNVKLCQVFIVNDYFFLSVKLY